jgi:hypothetical protein
MQLVEEDAGNVLEQKNPSGDMKLITIHCSPLLGLHLTNLAAFFEKLDKVTLKSSGVDPPSQASAKQAISSSQDEHSIPSPANCTPASGHPTNAMQVDQISLGEQVRPASEYQYQHFADDDLVSIGDETEVVASTDYVPSKFPNTLYVYETNNFAATFAARTCVLWRSAKLFFSIQSLYG